MKNSVIAAGSVKRHWTMSAASAENVVRWATMPISQRWIWMPPLPIKALTFQNHIYEVLVQRDANGKSSPGYTSWQQTDDTTIRFKLREGEFHNGNAFTALTMVASVARVMIPPVGSANASIIG
jgi:peptide/nickel transport system substrate-binding protein